MKKGKVFVGMSGGVDSSVSAYLLKEAGYDVVGVFIKVWHPDFLVCNWEEERIDAMRVAAHLNIPFLTCNAEDAYKRDVADYFIREYLAGRTPNPDVMCNTHVKFGHFYTWAKGRGADFIATGHYAQLEQTGEEAKLKKGLDESKDQSYFLWNVRKEVFRDALFPVGGMQKTEVRRIAEDAGLPTAQKKDSQGICFLGHIDVREFLSHYVDLKDGDVLSENGEIIGMHHGAMIYTIGQRHGFIVAAAGLSSEPHYVISKDIKNNTITVTTKHPEAAKSGQKLRLSAVNWIGNTPEQGGEVSAVIRYHGKGVAAMVLESANTTATIKILGSQDLPALGQSCVLYDGSRCLGGGIIERIES